MTGADRPFSVFTPYKNAWLRRLTPFYVRAYPVERYLGALVRAPADAAVPPLESLGFKPTDLAQLPVLPGEAGANTLLQDFLGRIEGYDRARDFPAKKGPSYLSVHLRFGTLSIRAAVRAALQPPPGIETGAGAGTGPPGPGRATWLSELIWRDFYQMILYQHPQVVDHAFRPAYDRIIWHDDPAAFDAWREGRTGYPLVDAAMAQINRTGYMHNRLRMVVASFLVKDLGIDWRRGERWFAQALIDYDLAANNGGWQWAASTGCDAQPYFRIFNPVTQSQRFDPEGRFIRRYLPQLAGLTAQEIHAPWLVPAQRQQAAGCVIGRDYPRPIVDHAEARARTLARFAAAREGGI
jgi:deoxyribodipyrimidine photo-lyase